MFNIELDVSGIHNEALIKALKHVGVMHNYDVFYHGRDRLVFNSAKFNGFTDMVNELSNVCQAYGINYVSLLV